MDNIFNKAWAGEIIVAYSAWNIGECIEVFDKRLTRRELNEKSFIDVLSKFVSETLALAEVRHLLIVPVATSILIECWPKILAYHIYEADILQITTCILEECDVFISGDEKLVEIAKNEKLEAFDIEVEEDCRELMQSLD